VHEFQSRGEACAESLSLVAGRWSMVASPRERATGASDQKAARTSVEDGRRVPLGENLDEGLDNWE
jgi:hypothetical protein